MPYFTLEELKRHGVSYVHAYVENRLDKDLAGMRLEHWFAEPGQTPIITPMFGALVLMRHHMISAMTSASDSLANPDLLLMDEDRATLDRGYTASTHLFRLMQEALVKISITHRSLLSEVKEELADKALAVYDAITTGVVDPKTANLRLRALSTDALLYRAIAALRIERGAGPK